jgi:hypothetical protein
MEIESGRPWAKIIKFRKKPRKSLPWLASLSLLRYHPRLPTTGLLPESYFWYTSKTSGSAIVSNTKLTKVLAYAYAQSERKEPEYRISTLIDGNEYGILTGVAFNMLYSVSGLFVVIYFVLVLGSAL